jgi:predicted regulator of Ras-like GTPase activity (Roadblock/LC7/MglB family)
VGGTQICAALVGRKAVLVVVFDDGSNLSLVRLRMKRARELILRSLEVA